MADKEVAGNTFIQLNNDSFSPDSIMDMMAALSSLTDEQIAKELDLQKSLQQIRMSNAEKLNLYNKKEQEELLQAEQRAAEMLIDKQRDAKQALIKDEYQRALDEVEKLTGFEKQQRLDQINEEFEARMENENKLAEDRKKKSEKAFKDELKRAKDQAKQKAKAEAEAGRKWGTALFDSNANFDAKKEAFKNIGKRTDKEGNTVRNAGTIAADIIGGLATLAKSMNNQIEEIAGKKSAIDTRLQGSKGATRGGSYWDQMSNNVLGMAGISPFVKQSDVANKIASMVDQGIAFNVEQRAMLDTLKDKIATTFDATNGTLLRLIRIQQQDTTAARLGMESALTSFLNNMYETTEYMRDLATSVKSNLEEAMSLMSGENALSFEYQVQKWMGSLYSVGMNSSSVQGLAGIVGQIAAGQLEGLTSGGNSNLAIMAANRAGLSIADMMAKGLDESDTNKLMTAMVEYLGDIYSETKDSKVIQQQYASIFGMTASDLKAAANLAKSTSSISKNGLSYGSAIDQLYSMAGSMYKRTSMGEMLNNMKSNAMYSMAGSIANNPVLYGINEMANLLDTFAGGIQLPFINTFFGGVDLHTSVADIMRSGAMLGGIGTAVAKMVGAGSGGGVSGTGILNALGIDRNQGSFVTRGTGAGLATARGLTTSSSGTTVSNSSMDDVKGKSMADATDDSNQQLAEASDDQDEITMKDINTNVINIYELLERVVNGTESFHVVAEIEPYSGTSRL